MIVPGGWRIRSGRLYVSGAMLFSIFLVSGCEPWGKPRAEPAAAGEISDFRILYSENCSGCHGVDGKNGPGRPLNNPLYLAVIPRDELQRTIENGRPGTAMPAWARSQGGPLSPNQVTALVNGIEQNWAKPASFRGATLPTYSVNNQSGDSTRGKKLFARNCFICHGQPQIGSITDPTFLALVSDQVLRTSIIEGRPDLGMPDYRNLNMGHALSDQDITDVVTYLSSLRPASVNVQNGRAVESATTQGGVK